MESLVLDGYIAAIHRNLGIPIAELQGLKAQAVMELFARLPAPDSETLLQAYRNEVAASADTQLFLRQSREPSKGQGGPE